MPKSDALHDVDLIIFDCDGVVVDSEVLACACLADALRLHGLDLRIDDVFDLFLGRSFSVVEDHYRSVTGKPLPVRFREDLRERLARSFVDSLTSMPHVIDVLKRLDRPYCLASSSDADRIRLTLAVTGLAPFFSDRVYDASMVSHGKPAPDLYLFIAGKMGAAPARALVVEDSVSGILAARAAGMKVWGFIGGSHCEGRDIAPHLLAAGADRVFDSMIRFMDV